MGSVGNKRLNEAARQIRKSRKSLAEDNKKLDKQLEEAERKRDEANTKYRNMTMVELVKLRNETYTRLELDTTMSDEEKRKLRNEYIEMQHVLANKQYKR